MFPPELLELTLCFYSFVSSNASEETVNAPFTRRSPGVDLFGDYLMNSVSRNWSRPTKDFVVRKRLKRSCISRF